MIEAPGFFLTILAFVLVIGPLVFVHEMGHYLAGRWFGVKAEAFSIGFGHEVFGLTDKRGTRWKFGWLPLGGYVKFAGDMNPASQPDAAWLSLPAAERAQTFQAQPLWQRAIIVAAGPAVNFVLAVLILMGFALAYGESRTPAIAREIVPVSAAAKAGMQPGDRITALGGRSVRTFDEVQQYIQLRADQPLRVDFDRGGKAMSINAAIGSQTLRDRFGNEFKIGLLGIAPVKPVWMPVDLVDAPGVAIKRTGAIVTMMVDSIGQIVTGRRSVSELGGPLRIAKVSGEQLSLGVPELIGLIALVSINLGFINILPVPMLDGGHLFFYAIEAVRRRPVKPEVQEWAFRGGLVALLMLMMLVTFNDLGAFGLWKNLAGLIG
ncbi:RIP metalloprotease RseP [Sphingomonas endolithica]|uniref:RIP metalloprotease RseP n=1 Tax=Sphingomonas endolithica TaxID=2972485 RepID=UPI0021AFBCD2|nr:RIP metalloprotease RseP [Sphingomonas sp. ZFBP2030]